MALRIRRDGRVLCAAMHKAEPGDTYLDDGAHYELSVNMRVLVTEAMEVEGGLGGHAAHGQWWWKGQEPEHASIDPFYYETDADRCLNMYSDGSCDIAEESFCVCEHRGLDPARRNATTDRR